MFLYKFIQVRTCARTYRIAAYCLSWAKKYGSSAATFEASKNAFFFISYIVSVEGCIYVQFFLILWVTKLQKTESIYSKQNQNFIKRTCHVKVYFDQWKYILKPVSQ